METQDVRIGGETLKALHVYEHTSSKFEERLNEALGRIALGGGTIEEILYAVDPSTSQNRKGGFGAIVIARFERGRGPLPAVEEELVED